MTREELDSQLAQHHEGPALNAPTRPVAAPPSSFRYPLLSQAGVTAIDALRAYVGPAQTDESRARLAAYETRLEAGRVREESEKRARAEERAALPEKLAARTDRRIMDAIQGQRSPCVLILGPTGIGKTSAMRWLQLRHRGTWIGARDLASCERRHALGEGEPPEITRACSREILYLDDLGTEDGRDIAVLKHVIDRRYANSYPTVVTTGLTKTMLTERYEAPTVRRLLEQHVRRRDGSEYPVLVVDCHE